jgi:hypothetical protein
MSRTAWVAEGALACVSLPAERSRILMEFPGADVNTLSAGQIVHDTP